MLHRFFGGVHPAGCKEATEQIPIAPLSHPVPQVVLPMSQHVGPPCKPVVSVGDQVSAGQVIGEPTGLGAPIHASVSGRVTAVEPRPHTGGAPVLSVVIDNDGLDTPAPPLARPAPPDELSPQQVVDLIRDAGITGMGGAGFPAHVKLSGAIGKVDTLILNGAECEPYITADHRLMLEEPRRVVEGGRVLMRALGLSRFYIGVEANKPDAIEALRAAAGPDVEVCSLRVRYPQGSEKQLIQNITGRQVPPGGLPAHVKCAVFNVDTAAAVYDAVWEGKPLTHRVVTVSGRAVRFPKNLLVPLGTPLQVLVDQCGGPKGFPGRILSGGPMMGVAQFDLSAPVIKGTNALLLLNSREFSPTPKGTLTCLHCGRCVTACPMRLLPLTFHQRFSAGHFEELESLRILDCIECGSCAYSCPAHIPLVQSIRAGKNEVRRLQAAAKAKAAQAQAKAEAEKTRAEVAQAEKAGAETPGDAPGKPPAEPPAEEKRKEEVTTR